MNLGKSNPGRGRWWGLGGLLAVIACVQARALWMGDAGGLTEGLLLGVGLAALGAGAFLRLQGARGAEDDPEAAVNGLEFGLRHFQARFQGDRAEAWYRWALGARRRVQALAYLEEAARGGHGEAHFELGLYFEESGQGQAGREVAARHYRAAAEAGHREAAYRLAELLSWGIGPARDPGAAQRWYLRSANDGFRPAMDWLARAYEFGEGLPEDLEKAVYWTVKARAAENSGLRISHFARAGAAAPRARPQEAPEDLRDAATRGEPQACFRLGMSFRSGSDGNPRDPQAAGAWLLRAAQAGHVEAMAELGDLLAWADRPGDARAWFKRAGAAGHQGAQIRLGQLDVPEP